MQEFYGISPWIILLIAAWTFPWKGVALWKAAKNNHLTWFIALLIINSLAILEILYIFCFQKRVRAEEKIEIKKLEE